MQDADLITLEFSVNEKPDAAYELVESVSPGPRLELFARRKRNDWHTWGNEVPCDVFMGPNVKLTGKAGTPGLSG